MLYSEIQKMGVGLQDGIDPTNIYPICTFCNRESIEQLISSGMDLSAVGSSAFKLFTFNEKERANLKNVLEKLEKLNLISIFNANLNIATFKEEVVARVEYCLNNGLPFVHQESNILIGELYSAEKFGVFSAQREPLSEVKTAQEVNYEQTSSVTDNNFANNILDQEDSEVRSSLLRTLLEIKEANKEDFTFGFVITNIIANLDTVIARDNKNYRVMGTRHLIEDALEGVSLTPEMKEEIDIKILASFPDSIGMGRGA